MEVDIHSNHCEKCINYVQCNKMKSLRKSRGEEYVCCPIIRCRLQCGHQFHQCKTYEHELLCPKVRLPCINSTFGCPLVMERRKRGPHLATCPARSEHFFINIHLLLHTMKTKFVRLKVFFDF